jgi:HSP20 family protein
MKEKRSFFQKITGGIGEDKQNDRSQINPSYEEELEDETQSWQDDQAEEEGELSVDVYQTEKDLVIEAMVAGVRPEDLQISLTRDMVTINGKREANKIVGRDDYFYQELYWGSFSRSIMLPHEIDIESSEAIEKHGMLIIKMPKIDKERQNKIKVKSL